jgi:hypothetical protein
VIGPAPCLLCGLGVFGGVVCEDCTRSWRVIAKLDADQLGAFDWATLLVRAESVEWEEKAAIMELDGGLDRATARRLAFFEVERAAARGLAADQPMSVAFLP